VNAQERLTLRAGYGPVDGPGPESRDDHAEEQVAPLGYGLVRATVRRGEHEVTADGWGPTAALANAYLRLERVTTLEEAWQRS
jgi:hypothetical protein